MDRTDTMFTLFTLISREYIPRKRKNALSVGYVLSKFAPSSCYTQQRLDEKNVVPQKVDKVDKEFKCEKNYPLAQKTKKLETK